MYGDNGIDRYEAQSIAESAARSAASEAERNVGYMVSRLDDEIRSLRLALGEERESRRESDMWTSEAIEELQERISILDGLVDELTKAVTA